jgi:hypothetical protein
LPPYEYVLVPEASVIVARFPDAVYVNVMPAAS